MKIADPQILSDPTIQTIINKIVKEIDPDRMILFGSRARGDASSISDYDICVLKDGIENKRNQITKQLYLSLHEVGLPIDLIVETIERFPMLVEFKSYIYRMIQRDGIIIYEKNRRSLRMA